MKLRILSDIHLGVHRDHGDEFQRTLNPLSSDEVLVLAGDIIDRAGYAERVRKRLGAFCEKWRRVIYVLGNHEYWDFSPYQVEKNFADATLRFPNLTWLHNSSAEIDGVFFYGGPLWFPPDPMDFAPGQWCDFRLIKGAYPWVFEQHTKFKAGMRNIPEGAVVVSHHLPSQRSLHERFKSGSYKETERYFVGDVEELIADRKPRLFIHGHTHEPMDYRFFETRVICNAFGYPMEPKSRFNERLVIDLSEEAPVGAEAAK